MAVCGRCFLCGSKFDCGPLTRCEGCANSDAARPVVFDCPRCDNPHKLCAGCLDVMHDLRGGLSDHEHAVLLALLERMRARTA